MANLFLFLARQKKYFRRIKGKYCQKKLLDFIKALYQRIAKYFLFKRFICMVGSDEILVRVLNYRRLQVDNKVPVKYN